MLRFALRQTLVTLMLIAPALAASPAEQRGKTYALTNCAKCHSIDRVTPSPLKIAPPLRTLHIAIRSKPSPRLSPKASIPAIRQCRDSSSTLTRFTTCCHI